MKLLRSTSLLLLAMTSVHCRSTATSEPGANTESTAAQSTSGAASQPDAAATDASTAITACRNGSTFAPAAAATPVAPSAPSNAAVRRACTAARTAVQREADRSLRALAPADRAALIGSLTGCLDAGQGAWTFAIDRVTPPAQGSSSFELTAHPVYIAPDGHTTGASTTVRLRGGPSPDQDRAIQWLGVATFDWDGDGRQELYFHESHSQSEGEIAAARDSRWWTFTVRNGTPVEFTPFAARALRIEDVDGDRKPDLVLRSPWVITGPCGMDQVDYPGPLLLAHALGDGTFSTTDEVAEGFVAHQCRTQPTSVLQGITGDPARNDSPANRIGCALWWGRSSSDLAAEIERTHGSASEEDRRCFPRPELIRVANVSAPEAFRLTCATP